MINEEDCNEKKRVKEERSYPSVITGLMGVFSPIASAKKSCTSNSDFIVISKWKSLIRPKKHYDVITSGRSFS